MEEEGVDIIFEDLIEFTFSEDFSIFYSKDMELWYVEDYANDRDVLLLEEEHLPLTIGGIVLSKEDFINLQKKVKELEL